MNTLLSSTYTNLIKRTLILPIVAFIAITALVFILWHKSVQDYQVWVKQHIQQAGDNSTQEFITIIRSEIIKVKNLKKRIEFTDGSHHQYWDIDANMILEQSNSIKFIEWIDSTMVIKKITPLKGNEGALNLDVSKIDYRNKEWNYHAQDSSINITPWSEMTQGGKLILVDVPAYYSNKFQGTVTAGMDFTEDFNKYSSRLHDYCIEIRDTEGTVIYEYNMDKKAKTDNKLTYNNQVVINNLNHHFWSLKLYPTNDLLFLTNKRTQINSTLLFGVIMSLLISMLIYFYLKSLKATSRVLNINRKLASVNIRLIKEKLKAEKASKAKTDFLSNMSHEIRTPLHAILGFIQVLKGSILQEKDKEYVELMDKSSNNLLAIVNDILEIHKIESGNIHVDEHLFCPSTKLKELVETYEYHFKKKGLYLKLIIKDSYGLNVLSDMNKFSQIITNLLKNALKFTNNGGIEVTYTEKKIADKLKIVMHIKDTGIGISKHKIATIFDRFTQIESSFKKQHEGSGLGLAISKDFARLLGGNITVQSSFNEGSTFTCTTFLNISNKNTFKNDETFENLKMPYLKVLVVDDNSINVIVVRKLLEDIGIHVDSVTNGEMAIKKFRANKYDLILMDIHMPQMDGCEATEIIRKEDHKILIIGLSANVTTTAIQKALDSGMTNYITKPFTKERLYKILLSYFG
ncbi:response regulator [Bizionia argentinensis JUB59]|uniref:histidine kinase n=1 Tax=Bizionia argentinensis JUB59 TaxID=1046627 RepID=G2EBH0_9FLAO|nr:response regulator [Bizionia argentinensis]EGV44111.1 response regulator [Bizionia argentinensis JUB59]